MSSTRSIPQQCPFVELTAHWERYHLGGEGGSVVHVEHVERVDDWWGEASRRAAHNPAPTIKELNALASLTIG